MFVALRINFILRRDVTFGPFLCVAAAVYAEILDLAFLSSLPVQRPVVKHLSPPPLLSFVTTLEPVRSDSYELRCTSTHPGEKRPVFITLPLNSHPFPLCLQFCLVPAEIQMCPHSGIRVVTLKQLIKFFFFFFTVLKCLIEQWEGITAAVEFMG